MSLIITYGDLLSFNRATSYAEKYIGVIDNWDNLINAYNVMNLNISMVEYHHDHYVLCYDKAEITDGNQQLYDLNSLDFYNYEINFKIGCIGEDVNMLQLSEIQPELSTVISGKQNGCIYIVSILNHDDAYKKFQAKRPLKK